MFNDMVWGEKELKRNVEVMLTKLRIVLEDFLAVSCLSRDFEKKWYGTHDGVWDTTAENLLLEFGATIHPLFRAFSALEIGELRGKGGIKKTSVQR